MEERGAPFVGWSELLGDELSWGSRSAGGGAVGVPWPLFRNEPCPHFQPSSRSLRVPWHGVVPCIGCTISMEPVFFLRLNETMSLMYSFMVQIYIQVRA